MSGHGTIGMGDGPMSPALNNLEQRIKQKQSERARGYMDASGNKSSLEDIHRADTEIKVRQATQTSKTPSQIVRL